LLLLIALVARGSGASQNKSPRQDRGLN